MQIIPVKKPVAVLSELRALFIEDNTPHDSQLELVISFSSENINIRELNAFLKFIDHVYGRLYSKGFLSYSLKRSDQLKISRIEQGTTRLIINTLVSEADNLAILWLCIKYLPHATLEFATAYNQYEQGRLARAERKRILNSMAEEGKLRKLTPKQHNILTRLLGNIYNNEAKIIARAQDFAITKLKRVYLKVCKQDKDNDF